MNYRKSWIIILLLIAVGMTGCRHARPTNDRQCDTVVDDYGETVVVPRAPQRIVSASPAVTEIIYALQADSLLVGRTDFCTYPTDALEVESIGGISNLNVEKIVSLQPDLVISGSMVPRDKTQQLSAMGIPVVCVIEKAHYEDMYNNILSIGKLIGRYDRAVALVKQLSDEFETNVKHLSSSDTVPTVYYVVGYGSTGNFTAGGNTFINDIIRMAGGRNVAEELTGWSYSLEALMEADPDYIVVRREDSASFCSAHPYNRLTAVKEHRVVGINSGWLDLQTPRNLQAVIYLNHIFNKK